MPTLALTIGTMTHDALPVTADELAGFHFALNTVLKDYDPDGRTKSAKRLELLDSYIFNWLCAARVAEGPAATVSPLKAEPA